MLKNLILIIFSLPLISFGQVIGTFSRNGMGSETFCFDIDGTYIFTSATDLEKITDKGTYTMNGDTLILNSNVQANDLLKVKKWKIQQSDSLYISINLFSGQELFLSTLIINDTIKYPLINKNGIVSFKKGYVQTIKIDSRFLPWELSNISFSVEDNNIIEVLIDDTKGFKRVFFTNDKFIFKKTLIQSVNKKEYVFTIQPNLECKE